MTEPVAIADRLHRFYRFVDEGAYEAAFEFFTADSLLIYGEGTPRPGKQCGTEILEAWLARRIEQRPPQRHVASNLVLDAQPDGITATSVLTIYKFVEGVTPTIALVADVVQHWDEIGGDWKMLKMHIQPVSAAAD